MKTKVNVWKWITLAIVAGFLYTTNADYHHNQGKMAIRNKQITKARKLAAAQAHFSQLEKAQQKTIYEKIRNWINE